RGQLLFEMDPRPLQAAPDQAKGELARVQGLLRRAEAQLQQAQASLAQAEANQRKTQLDANRYTQLVEGGVASRQDYDNAVQANLAAIAAVKAAEAGSKTAQAHVEAAHPRVQDAETG